MRVVSQKRNYSIDFDRTVFWVQLEVIYAKIGTESIAIGQYESDKRAAEVFEDMHNAYSDMQLIFRNIEIEDDLGQKLKEWGNKSIITNLPDEPAKVEQIGNSVYYMPEE